MNLWPPIWDSQGTVLYTVCPRSSDQFYILTYYIKWVTTSWTDGIYTNILQTIAFNEQYGLLKSQAFRHTFEYDGLLLIYAYRCLSKAALSMNLANIAGCWS